MMKKHNLHIVFHVCLFTSCDQNSLRVDSDSLCYCTSLFGCSQREDSSYTVYPKKEIYNILIILLRRRRQDRNHKCKRQKGLSLVSCLPCFILKFHVLPVIALLWLPNVSHLCVIATPVSGSLLFCHCLLLLFVISCLVLPASVFFSGRRTDVGHKYDIRYEFPIAWALF